MKTLGTVSICGISYTVFERSVAEDNQLADSYAYIVHDPPIIVIRQGLPPEFFRNALMHEIEHGIWEQSGVRQVVAGPMKDMELEEAVVQVTTPHRIAALASMKRWRAR